MPHPITPLTAAQTFDLRHRVLWPDQPRDFVIVPGDDAALHFGVLDNGQVIGIVSMFDTDDGAQLRKLATDPAFQGRGIGSALVAHVVQTARISGTHRIFLSGRHSALDFYKSFGFAAYGDPYLVENVPCQKMEIRF